MKLDNKIKKLVIALILSLGLLTLTTAQTTQTNPLNPTYEPNKQYEFILLDDLQDKVYFKIENEFIFISKENINYDENENYYLVNIDDLSAGTYNYTWTIVNETNQTNTTIQEIYEVQKAIPDIVLKLNSKSNNLTINESDSVNITASMSVPQGELELLINGEVKKSETAHNSSNTTINLIYTFKEPKKYTVTARYKETENYTSKEITLFVDVQKLLLIEVDKSSYNLGEQIFFFAHAPLNTEVVLRLCKNDLINPAYQICYDLKTLNINQNTANIQKDGKNWKRITLDESKNPGPHIITAKIKNTNIERQIEYDVKDTMTLKVEGETNLKINEETTLKATATNGISPYTYTWTFPDGSTKTGAEQKIKYSTQGDRTIKVQGRDKEGNIKESTITLKVKRYHDLTVEVRNSDNSILQGAVVTVLELSESKLTDSTGKIKFNIPEDDYRVRISAEGYETKTETVKVDSATSMTVRLAKRDVTTTSTAIGTPSEKIKLSSPDNNAKFTNSEIEFSAEIKIDATTTCKLFITDKNSLWFVEFARIENVKQETISFKEKIDDGEYKWKISCESENVQEESEVREFSIATAQVSISSIEETIDAGELRRKIEQAYQNLDALDMESRRAADAMDLSETLRIALRDYERILRDINSLAMRRDLVEVQKQDKLNEYKEAARKLERETPLKLDVLETEEFIIYPDKNELEEIAKKYGEERNLQGRLDLRDLEAMQNLLRTRTFTALIRITYMNGDEEDITLVHKTIEYTGLTNRNQFLVESIPSHLNSDVTIKQTHDVIKRNEIFRFEKPESITYTIKSHKELEDIKQAHTLLFSEGVFKAGSSSSGISAFTGRITNITTTNVSSTTGLIIILIILIIAYLAYAFDVKEKAVKLFSNFGKDKKIKELNDLISDAKDYLDSKNLERANLIYKEIRMIYEKSSAAIQNEIYNDAVGLINVLNENYIEYVINKINQEIESRNKSKAVKYYNKIIEIYNKLEAETQKKFKSEILKINKKIKSI